MKKEVKELLLSLIVINVISCWLIDWKIIFVTSPISLFLFVKIKNSLSSIKQMKREKEFEIPEIELSPKVAKSKIEEAIKAGEVIRIKYLSGSHPEETREISPIRVEKKGLLRAYCHKDMREKTFDMSKIVVFDLEDAG